MAGKTKVVRFTCTPERSAPMRKYIDGAALMAVLRVVICGYKNLEFSGREVATDYKVVSAGSLAAPTPRSLADVQTSARLSKQLRGPILDW